jgi:hypothetical protein
MHASTASRPPIFCPLPPCANASNAVSESSAAQNKSFMDLSLWTYRQKYLFLIQHLGVTAIKTIYGISRLLLSPWIDRHDRLARIFNDIGLLDEGYFTYYDDIDFCFNARNRGWPTSYVPASRVVHVVGNRPASTENPNVFHLTYSKHVVAIF